MKEKVFLIFNTACFGDNLVCNALCQNIKRIYPDSKIVFIVDKPFYEAAKYQKDVDDVVIFDKKGANRSLIGILKFILNFKYKKAYASMVTYRNERNYIVSSLTGSRVVTFKSKYNSFSAQERHNLELRKITNKKVHNYPIKYCVPDFARESVKNKFPNLKDYTVICTTSKRKEKDMPISTAVDLVKKFSAENKQIVYVGAGDLALNYAEQLKSAGCKFIDLTNQTTIPELGAVLENAECVISVDTGVMHFGYAVGTPVTAVFYEPDYVRYWAPNPQIYKSITISSNQSADNIYNAYTQLCESVASEKTEFEHV